MKSTKYFLFISFFIFFGSCKQADVPYFGIEFLFKETQPIND